MSQKRCRETMPAPERAPPSPDPQQQQSSAKRPRQSSPDKAASRSPTSLLSPGVAASPNPTGEAGEHMHDDGPLGGSSSGSGGTAGAGAGAAAARIIGQSSSFRNVSACNRCRLRKNRCDQKLPSCASCDKAGVACVGYDPITKREIPRSYIFYLEKRVEQLEGILTDNDVSFPPAQDLDYCSKSVGGGSSGNVRSPTTEGGRSAYSDEGASHGGREGIADGGVSRVQKSAAAAAAAASRPGSTNRYLGSASGISFARVVYSALQSSVSDQKSNSDKGGVRPYRPQPAGGNGNGASASASGTSMRDSFFGLHTKPTIHPATFPDKALGLRLASLFFEHANPQIPILHKGEFMDMFERAYAEEGRVRGPRELYVLNMVFAIGAGIIVGDSRGGHASVDAPDPSSSSGGARQCQPEEYHASAIVHLEACLGSGGGLKDLQAVLLLANFALLRPVPPGLWYIIGVAVRLAVDLGLHYEDGKEAETVVGDASASQDETVVRAQGRRQYVRDLRRRLWWCTYSLDRLVSICVGRPVSISDTVITTEFPSLLEDRYITPSGIVQPPRELLRPTYKLVAHHYFRLRLLQSEILQVLQFRHAQSARASSQNHQNPYMHTDLSSPFLSKFGSFRSWRIDIDRRLWEWKNSAPTKQDTGVAFSTDFLDLNYWQAIIMLYRQSLSVPTVFEGEYDTSKEVNSPAVYNAELREDEDRVYLKVAEAGQKILRLYRQLHLMGIVNHTYLTTHHLFVAGIAYLYAIWHSPIVRSRLTMDEVDFTVLAATSVFTDFMDKCPPAEACRDAFDRTVKATLKMVNASGGFGQQYHAEPPPNRFDYHGINWSTRPAYPQRHQQTSIDISNPYSLNIPTSTAFPKGAAHRPPVSLNVKTEPDGFLGRNLAMQSRSKGSRNTINNNPSDPDATVTVDTPAISPPTASAQQQQRQLTSPSVQPLRSPSAELGQPSPLSARTPTRGFLSPTPPRRQQQEQQQQQQQFSPGAISLGDLQGMEFLQDLNPTSNPSATAPTTNPNPDPDSNPPDSDNTARDGSNTPTMMMMDGVDFSGLADTQLDLGMGGMGLGFGLGWEGSLLHDGGSGGGFYDDGGMQQDEQGQQQGQQQGLQQGQQLDLFDGFFFGGPSSLVVQQQQQLQQQQQQQQQGQGQQGGQE